MAVQGIGSLCEHEPDSKYEFVTPNHRHLDSASALARLPVYRMSDNNSDRVMFLRRRVQDDSAEFGEFCGLADHLMEMGMFSEAAGFCRKAIDRFGRLAQGYYVRLGVCEWLLNESERAVGAWKGGLECTYRDPAGGLYPRLLLWLASLVNGDEELGAEAVSHINRALLSRRAVNWPGSVGKFVVGQMSEVNLRKEASELDKRLKFPSLAREALFFVGVLALSNGDRDRAKVCFRECTQLYPTAVEYDLYLARHELARIESADAAKRGAE